MRNMRTNGASKNQDYCGQNGVIYKNWSTYGMYKYLWYVYVPKVCISTYGMYKYLWYVMYTYGMYAYGMYTYGMYTYGM